MIVITATSSVITELVGGLTASFKSVWDAFQVEFDGLRVLPPSSVATPCLNASVSWPACVGERH